MTTIHTVGHSTRSADEFLTLLATYEVGLLVDVRQYPGSRRYPYFAREALASSLAEADIQYVHEVDLGGRRQSRGDSPNLYWQNASFRAYADYMAGDPFLAALARLIARAAEQTTAIMCAEAVPWRCHRWLIADALVARQVEVVHILDESHSQRHELNAHARIAGDGTITYPAPLFAGGEA
jgi:uncharacterized protein (DUF488 family)